MKVLHLVHWPRSGIGVVVRDLVRHRSSDIQHVVVCLAPGTPVTDQIRAAGAEVSEPTKATRGWLRRTTLLKARLRRDAPDVVHSHSITPRVIAALAAAGIPHVTTVHTAYLYFRTPGLRNAIKRLLECGAARRLNARYVCVSEDVARSLPCEAMASRALVIENGIDIEAVRAAPDGAGAPVAGDPLLVAAGRLEWEKGYDRLLKAVAAIRLQFPGLRLVVCGDGGERAALEAQARDLGLDHIVRFTGHVENPMPFLRAADAFVSTSVQEGFGLTTAEAMALGRPAILTPVSGLSSVLLDGETAILTSGFSPDDIARALVRALSDRERLQRVAQAGQRFAEAHFDVRRAVAEYESVYRNLMGLAKA